MRRINGELFNRYQGDELTCTACKQLIHRLPFGPSFSYRDITNAYKEHAQGCFGLRRLIVMKKRNTLEA